MAQATTLQITTNYMTRLQAKYEDQAHVTVSVYDAFTLQANCETCQEKAVGNSVETFLKVHTDSWTHR